MNATPEKEHHRRDAAFTEDECRAWHRDPTVNPRTLKVLNPHAKHGVHSKLLRACRVNGLTPPDPDAPFLCEIQRLHTTLQATHAKMALVCLENSQLRTELEMCRSLMGLEIEGMAPEQEHDVQVI